MSRGPEDGPGQGDRGHWVVRGAVQGVMFRASARERAGELGLECRAWNRDDGAVEVEAEGPRAALEQLERWLRRGPPLARVESVERLG